MYPIVIRLCFVVLFMGTSVCLAQTATPERPVMVAKRAAQPVVVDGKLDEAVWKSAPTYAYHLADDRDLGKKDAVREPGEVRLAWDKDFFYVAVRFTDSDVNARGTKRNEFHFEQGDTAEVFLKPLSNTVYWELYVTPHSMTSTYCFPSFERRQEPASFQYQMKISVAGAVEGTLNNAEDTDRVWTGEMAIPRAELERWGDAFPGKGWTILAARYNYSRALGAASPELTMTPRLPQTNYHYHAGYALLRLEE